MRFAPRAVIIAVVTVTLTLGIAGCTGADPAQPAPVAASDAPASALTPTPTPSVTFADVVLEVDDIAALGAQIVLMRGTTRDTARLYSLAQQDSAPLILDVEPGETVEGVSWAVEQAPDADPIAVALVYITTKASGLNATADKIQMRVFDDTGIERSRIDLGNGVVGTPYKPGDLGGAKPSRSLAVMNGTAVLTTELTDGSYAALGYDTTTASEEWRLIGPEEPGDSVTSLSNGLVVLSWQGTLTAFKPATGAIAWTSDGARIVNEDGNAPYVVTAKSSPASAQGSIYAFLNADSGTPRSMPEMFNSYAVDAVTGESSFYWHTLIGSDPADQPGILVRSAANTDLFALDGEKTTAAGVQSILAMWNGLIWIETNAGTDIVEATTGDRAPGIDVTDEVLRVPEHASNDWTMTKINGGTFGEDVRILTRHPAAKVELADLSVLAPAPAATTRP